MREVLICCQSFKLKLCNLKCMVGTADPASFIVGTIAFVTAPGARTELPEREREMGKCNLHK